MGRLLITFLLCERKILQRPLLYLSYYFRAHRAQYYDRLTAVRNDGDWEGWLKFFLRGVYEVSQSATETAREISALRERHRELFTAQIASAANALKLLDFMYQHPIFSVKRAQAHMGCAYNTAAAIVQQVESLGVVREVTGQQRNRLYRYDAYLTLFDRQALQLPADSTERDSSSNGPPVS